MGALELMLARGIVIGQEDLDTALVRLASEDEARELVRQKDCAIAIAHVPPTDPRAAIPRYGDDVFVLVDGQLQKCGVVTRIESRHSVTDVTSFSDRSGRFVRGRANLSITVEGIIGW